MPTVTFFCELPYGYKLCLIHNFNIQYSSLLKKKTKPLPRNNGKTKLYAY